MSASHCLRTIALAILVAVPPAPAQVAAPPRSDSLATLRVRTEHNGKPVSGASVRASSLSQTVDANGVAVLRLSAGSHVVITQRIGFRPDTSAITLRAGQDTTVMIELERQAADMERIVVAATRSERRVEDTPLRVEVIDEEEVAEKVAMTPGDIAMMLNETSGLRVATTSPSLGGANVRIQGLRGRYTLMLMDGLPLTGAGGGFSLLQIPPVDLARAEVIKGTATALYGPDALGGVINLVSRRPGDVATREVIVNQTSRGGSDAVLYASGRQDRDSPIGISAIASTHRQRENDLDGDGWADMAGYSRSLLRPRLFVDGDSRSLFATAGYTDEDRFGGTMEGRTTPAGTTYKEGLDTRRVDGGVVGRAIIRSRDILAVRASATRQRHRHEFGNVAESDRHHTGFAEASATLPRGPWTLVAGTAYQLDTYRNDDVPAFNYEYRSPAAFAQIDSDIARWLVLSGSGRADWHNVYGASVSPRLSAMIRAPGNSRLAGWTARVSGGTGTSAPSPLTEETEASGLTPLRPSSSLGVARATSGSVDVNGSVNSAVGRVEINMTAYASRIHDAIAVRELTFVAPSGQTLELANAPVPTRTWGAEALARLVSGDARLTATYAYLRASEWDPQAGVARRDVSLAPRHTAGLVGSVEQEDAYRIGFEVYYTGRQALENNPYRAQSAPYVIVGFLGERHFVTGFGRARLFVNAENIGNVRQTHFDPLLLPARGPGGRWTTDAWTELAGATFNGGLRLTF